MISLLLMAALTWAQNETPERAALTCFQHELDLYEARHGRLPSADQADLMIDYCMEKYSAKIKEQQEKKEKPTQSF